MSSSVSGRLIVSLDFELYWGVRDRPNVTEYLPNLVGARAAIPEILAAFTTFGIHATWATVGFLFSKNGRILRDHVPQVKPHYTDPRLSPYADLPPLEAKETDDSIWFAPSLVQRIAETPNQEIATHTFSHYYCLEDGSDKASFREDLRAARQAASEAGIKFRSLVFPRNQCVQEYLDVAREEGITAYRGNAAGWLYQPSPRSETSYLQRAVRLTDSYLNLAAPAAYPMPDRTLAAESLANVQSSRFLRPYEPKARRLEPLRLHRIKQELTYAAKRGLVYHLWWHPHNFGRHTAANIGFLSAILRHFRRLQDRYAMTSMNMAEVADCFH